jgi:glycosyltransferase involved in cell wall biosynthesis
MMSNTNCISEAKGHAVFHSVINRTGATRYLLTQVLPTLGAHHLVLWWPEITSAQDEFDVGGAIYLRGSEVTSLFARSRIVIFALQILYLLRHRNNLQSVTINSISNFGAIIGCLFMRADAKITVVVHERPIGKWRLSIAVLRRIKAAKIVTVSPFNKTELHAAGLLASWAYPSAFDTDLTQTAPQSAARIEDSEETLSDIVIVSHPDRSKGFALLCALLETLDSSFRVHLYLSYAPSTEIRFPSNVLVRVGQRVTRDHYRARLTVITSDPIGVKETFSFITAESLAAGTPVLCFPSGGISEQIIHGVNGHFVSDYSAASYKAEIESLFADTHRLDYLHAGTVAVNGLKARYCA